MAPPSAIEVTSVTDTTGVTLPDPLAAHVKSNEVHGRRRKADKSQWGVAAPADSVNFRLKSYEGKPKARRWDHIISSEARIRKGNSLKQAARFLSKPGLISLGGGLPSSEYFPFEELSLKVPAIGHFSEEETRDSGVVLTIGKHDLAAEKSTFDIATAFNYGQGSGSAQLLRWITEHTEMVHSPPYEDWRCTMTIGSTSALDMALRILARPGDTMLYEEFTFSAAIETATPMGIAPAAVPMDDEGLLPDEMDALLSNWDEAARGRKPHLLYTIPTGQNPTGATQSAARRRALYAVCRKHDIFILEDEPYYFLQMAPYAESPPGSQAEQGEVAPEPTSHESFLDALVPSFLSMDTDGRVMRMDSFSKVLSPGSRVGWITAPQQLVEKYQKHADVSTQGPSGMAQLLLFKLLDEHWGHAGYLDWLMHIRRQYTLRRDGILRACAKFLPREVVGWKPPMAGMFHWMKVDVKKHPRFGELRVEEIEERVFMRVIEHGALVMRGSWFLAEPGEGLGGERLFFRATYAAAPAQKIEEGIRRLGEAVREEFGLGRSEE
ncbi:aromatic amino acid aminotransferase 1 [Corynespora cassiicola Philippines]|uniref:aromatic-amino-acid transaminase n=1 Tax=Corynespora cassiicola Philippines TaxID=1448308 RepID=A0A2T2NWA1_CORCC|nr:aromatic amino acid aminotransferase 1 [Corynespora cassiicola Philippines]